MYVKNSPMSYSDPSGNSAVALIVATITAKTVIEVVVEGTTIIVTVGYFFSKEGQKRFKNAVRVVCDGIVYIVKDFVKK